MLDEGFSARPLSSTLIPLSTAASLMLCKRRCSAHPQPHEGQFPVAWCSLGCSPSSATLGRKVGAVPWPTCFTRSSWSSLQSSWICASISRARCRTSSGICGLGGGEKAAVSSINGVVPLCEEAAPWTDWWNDGVSGELAGEWNCDCVSEELAPASRLGRRLIPDAPPKPLQLLSAEPGTAGPGTADPCGGGRISASWGLLELLLGVKRPD